MGIIDRIKENPETFIGNLREIANMFGPNIDGNLYLGILGLRTIERMYSFKKTFIDVVPKEYLCDGGLNNLVEFTQYKKQDFHCQDFKFGKNLIRRISYDPCSTTIYPWSSFRYSGNIEEINQFFGQKLKEKFGSSFALNLSNLDISPSEIQIDIENPLILKLEEKIKLFESKGYTHSLLLYGPPGTGKSSIARSLGLKLGSYIELRSAGEDIEKNNRTLNFYLNMFKPKIILIEDLDHHVGTNMLQFLERLKAKGFSIIATCNRLNELDSALIRPGRFDQVIKIDQLDPQIVLNLVGNDKNLFDLLKDYPVASINEFMKRIKILGMDATLNDWNDIKFRAEAQKAEYDKL